MLAFIASTEENACSNVVRCFLPNRKSATQLYAKSGSGNWTSFFNRVLCRTVSNALYNSEVRGSTRLGQTRLRICENLASRVRMLYSNLRFAIILG